MAFKHLNSLLICSFALMLLAACNRDGNYQYHVINESGRELRVTVRKSGDSVLKKLLVMPKTEMMVSEVTDIPGGGDDLGDHFLKWFDSLYVAPGIDSLKVTKPIKSRDSWSFEADKKKNNAVSRYKFTVTDGDLK